MLSKTVKFLILTTALLFITLNIDTAYEYAMFHYAGRSVVLLSSDSMLGTGFQITAPSGKQFILTNMHVCGSSSVLNAEDFEGGNQKVAVLEVYPHHDLCLVQGIPNLPSLRLGNEPSEQQKLFTIGHPQGLKLVLESGHFLGSESVTVGYSCTEEQRKECTVDETARKIGAECFYRLLFNICPKDYQANYTNNSIAPGSSGSPIVDRFGRVVGVIFAGSQKYNKIAFSVPIDEVKIFLKDK